MILERKLIVPLLVLFLLSACGQHPQKITSNRDSEIANLERQIELQKSRLAKAKSRIAELQIELGPDAELVVQGGYRSAPEIIEELMELKMTAARRVNQRRLGFLFESLAEQGDTAVPHIRDFLRKMEDVDFIIDQHSEKDIDKEKEHWRSRMVNVPLEFEYPPSLRIGLIEILAEIGGPDAQDAIAEVLTSSGRGFEVAYSANKLRSMLGKDAYRDEALNVAHDLLTDPIDIVGGNKFDAASKQYLFAVLKMYGDKTFVQTAQAQLINEEGRIDRSVLSYFENIGGGRAIDAVVQAMQSGQLRETDMREMARVAVQGVGQNNVEADSLFQDIMTSDQYSLDVKMETIRSMDNSEDLTNMDKSEQAAVLQSRLDLMDRIQLGEDDIMSRANEIYSGRIEAKLENRGFDDERRYDAMHADFRKINEQVKREQRSVGGTPVKAPSGPTIIPGG
jgi:hypothetical protein